MDRPVPQATATEEAWLGAFAHPPFAVLWLASAVALVGIAMYDTASGWLMTTLALEPLEVSLVQVATTLPMFLFTLPAGALADIVDSRRLILVNSCAIAALVALFAVIVFLKQVSPVLLLVNTFVLSALWSINAPAWLAILPLLVPRSDLAGAIAANGVAYNLSRALGPALAGVAIAHSGLPAPYFAFAATNVVVVASLLLWRAPVKRTASLPAERLSGAVRTGIRHAINNRLFRATIVRTLAIYPFTAAYIGLMPLIARASGEGAEHYGLLLSLISVGAIVGSLAQRFLRLFVNLDWLTVLGSLGTAATLVLFGTSRDFAVLAAACICGGFAWVLVLTSLYVSAQNVLPGWVRGRGLAIFLTVIFGAVAAFSALWGQAAATFGLERALMAAAAGALIAIPLSWRWKLQQAEAIDLSPSLHYRRPEAAEEIADDRGPVLVKIVYFIDAKVRDRFLHAIDELGEQRRRDGAFAWGVFEDMAEPDRFEEGYLVESWLELLHFRERVTKEDRVVEDEIREMLTKPPTIEFLVAGERHPLRRLGREAPAGA